MILPRQTPPVVRSQVASVRPAGLLPVRTSQAKYEIREWRCVQARVPKEGGYIDVPEPVLAYLSTGLGAGWHLVPDCPCGSAP